MIFATCPVSPSTYLNCEEDGAGLSSSGNVCPVAECSDVGMATAGLEDEEEGDVCDEGEMALVILWWGWVIFNTLIWIGNKSLKAPQKSTSLGQKCHTGWTISPRTLVVLTRISAFHHLANLPATSAKFPSAQVELGRKWNSKNQVFPNHIRE